MRAGYFLGTALGTTALAISGCGVDSAILNGPNPPCYYMASTDIEAAVGVFGEIARAGIPRAEWISWNGHPCDSFPDLAREVPREDCARCFDYISDMAGWE